MFDLFTHGHIKELTKLVNSYLQELTNVVNNHAKLINEQQAEIKLLKEQLKKLVEG